MSSPNPPDRPSRASKLKVAIRGFEKKRGLSTSPSLFPPFTQKSPDSSSEGGSDNSDESDANINATAGDGKLNDDVDTNAEEEDFNFNGGDDEGTNADADADAEKMNENTNNVPGEDGAEKLDGVSAGTGNDREENVDGDGDNDAIELSSGPDSDSDDDSGFEMGLTIKPPPPPLRQGVYLLQEPEIVSISSFGNRRSCPPNGQCGIVATVKTTKAVREREGVMLNSQEESNSSFQGCNVYRSNTAEYFLRHMHDFVNDADPMILDRYGQPDPVFKLKLDANGNVVKNFFDYDGNRVSCIGELVDKIYNARYFEGCRGGSLPSRFWMDALFFLPIRCHQNRQSYVLYDESGTTVDNKPCKATIFLFFRPDGKIQKFIFPYYRKPFRGCAPLWYNGINHFEWIEYHHDYNDWAPEPVLAMPDESEDESTSNANGNAPLNEDDDTSVIPRQQNAIDNDVVFIGAGHPIPDDAEQHLSSFVEDKVRDFKSTDTSGPTNKAETDADLVDDAQANKVTKPSASDICLSSTVEDTKPTASKNPPTTPRSMFNTPSGLEKAMSLFSPTAIDEHVDSKPDAYHQMEVYENPIDTPMKEDIIKRNLKQDHPYFINQTGNIVHFRSEGSYHLSISQEQFYSLMDVTKSSMGKVQYLKWRHYPNLSKDEAIIAAGNKKKAVTALYITQLLKQIDMFKDHYDPRFQQGCQVLSTYSAATDPNVKSRSSRAQHDFAAYASGKCSHHRTLRKARVKEENFCESTVLVGFKVEEIQDLVSNPEQKHISLHAVVKKNCSHLKHQDNSRLEGPAREEFIRSVGFNADGKLSGPSPKELYTRHNGLSSLGKAHTPIKNEHAAFNASKSMRRLLLDMHGLSSTDRSANFWKGNQIVVSRDINRKMQFERLKCPNDPKPIDKDFAGVLRSYRYVSEKSHKGSTPLIVTLFSEELVKAYHVAASTGRLVVHFDGSGCDTSFGESLLSKHTRQRWPMWLNPSFMTMFRSKKARRKISPLKVFEFISTLTASEDMIPELKSFFLASVRFFGKLHPPLLVSSDCMKGIQTTFLAALNVSDKEPITRLQYNNFILCMLAQYDEDNWDSAITHRYFTLAAELIPTKFLNCRPHVVRAARRHITSVEREAAVRNNVKGFEKLVVRLMRAATSVMTVSEIIVHLGLMIYLCGKKMIRVNRMSVLSSSSTPKRSQVETMGENVKLFIQKEVKKIQTRLSDIFGGVIESSSIDLVDSSGWIGTELAKSVASDAQDEDLTMWICYCSEHEGKMEIIKTVLCSGYMARIPKKDEYPTFDHYRGDRQIRYVSGVVSRVLSTELTSQAMENVYILNPVYAPTIPTYLTKEWTSSIASYSSGIIHVCTRDGGTEPDNSNSLCESMFKWLWKKQGSTSNMYGSDPGLFIIDWFQQSIEACELWVNDLDKFGMEVSAANARTALKKKRKFESVALENMALEDATENTWRDGSVVKKIALLAEELSTLLREVEGIQDRSEQYRYVNEFILSEELNPIPERPFHNWMQGFTQNPVFLRDVELVGGIKMLIANMIQKKDVQSITETEVRHKQFALDKVSNMTDCLDFKPIIEKARVIRREKWGLLVDPECVTFPRVERKKIQAFIDSVVNDSTKANDLTFESTVEMARYTLPKTLLNGDVANDEDTMPIVLSGRQLVDNVVSDQPILCSRYSVNLHPCDSAIKRMMRDWLPADVVAQEGDTKESLAIRQASSSWLDMIHQHGNEMVTGNPHCKTPNRRTMSNAVDKPYNIIDVGFDHPDFDRSVVKMYSYICREAPLPRWQSRVTRLFQLAFMLEIYMDGFAFSTELSRQLPPNFMQICVYTALNETGMGRHRDNYTKAGLQRMKKGLDPGDPDATYLGVRNSQVHGTNVYVYTVGNAPMKMVFAFPNPSKGSSQNVEDYLEIDCYSIECGDGHLTVLDPMDDVFGQHGLCFDSLELVAVRERGSTDLRHRFAVVMRRCGNVEEFYMDTSTIRLDERILEALEKSTANNSPVKKGEGRNGYD